MKTNSLLSRRLKVGIVIIGILAATWSSFARAANGNWSTTSGTWSASGNWSGGTIPGATSGTTNTDTATFSTSSGGTVTVDANRNLRNITFGGSAGSFTFNTGPLLLTTGGMIQLAPTTTSSGKTEAFNTPITLEGTNALGGITTLANFSSADSMSFTGSVTAATGGTTLFLDGSNTGTNTISGSVGGGAGGASGGKINIVKDGSGSWTLAGTNMLGGTSAYVMPNSGTLTLDFSNAASPTANIINSGSRVVMGGGTLAITGGPGANNSQQVGFLAANEGASNVILNANGASSLVLNLNQSSGTATLISANVGSTMDFTLGANTAIDYTNASQTSGSVLRDNGYLVGTANGGADWAAENAAGTQIVAGSSISGFYTASTATSLVGNADAVTATTTLSANSSATTVRFNTPQATTISTGSYKMTPLGVLVTPTFAGNTATISGTISATAYSILDFDQYDTAANANLVISATLNNATNTSGWAKNGGGLLTLSTTANNIAAAAYLNGGITNIAADTSLGAAPSSATPKYLVFNGGTLQMGASGIAINSNRGITLNSNGGTLDTNGYSASYGGVIDGVASNFSAGVEGTSGTFMKAGAGTLTLSGANLTAGGFSINDGVLSISSIANGGVQAATSGSSGSSTVTVLNADATGLAVGQALSGAPDLVNDGTTITALSTGTAYTNVTLSSTVANTDSGIVNYGTPSALGLSTNASTNLTLGSSTGATLQYTGPTASTDRLFQLNNTVAGLTDYLDASGTGAVSFTNTGAVTYGTPNLAETLGLTGVNTGQNTLAATVGNNGSAAVSLLKTGNGTWVLSGANTYTGQTTVNAGRLVVSGSTSSAGTLVIGGGGTLSGTGSVGNVILSGGGTINLQDGSIDSLSVASLTTGGDLASTLDFDIQTSGSLTTVDHITDDGYLTLGPSTTIRIANLSGTSTLTDGLYPLISVTGTETGSMADFTLGGTALGDGQTLSIEQVGQSVDLDVASPSQYTINTGTLGAYVGVHPRLFISASSLSTLISNIEANQSGAPRWGEMWSSFKNAADYIAVTPPTVYTSPTGTADEELWERNVGDNMAILAMAYNLTKPTAPSSDTVWFEAEDMPVNSPMTVSTGTGVSGGAYISTPVGGTTNTNPNLAASASYYFSTQTTQPYYVWMRVYAPSSSAASWFLNIDGTPNPNYIQNTNPASANYVNASTSVYGSWTWVEEGPFYMTPGNHVLNLTYETQGVQFDKFAISTNGGLDPSGYGTEQHWLEARNFSLNANGVSPNLYKLVVTGTNSTEIYGDAISASHGYLDAYSGEAVNSTVPTSTQTPDAQQTVNVNGGSYDIWVRIKGLTKGHGSFYFEDDTNGYSSVTMESSSVSFPYNVLISPTLLAYNKKLTSPYNAYPYFEWVWVKAANDVALTAGAHTLKASNEDGCLIDRFLVNPAGTAAPADPNKYLAAAFQWAVASCNYPTWGTGDYAGQDLAAAHQLMGLGIVYDWCYSNLGATDLATIGSKLGTAGATMNTAATTSAWWKNSFLMNHLWEDVTGLTTAGLAIYGDTGSGIPSQSTLQSWLQTSQTKINNTMTDLGSDGADQEGVGYYGYGVEHLLKYMDMANKLMGMNMFGTPWFQESANYRLYFDLPANQQVANLYTNINLSDDPGYEWNGPDYQLRKFASLYNLPTAQWQAEHYDTLGLNGWNDIPWNQGTSPWLNLVWYNPSVAETSPQSASTPTMGYFGDLDFVVSRSSWSGNESVMAYQCGPFMGHGVQAKNKTDYIDWGSEHVHPNAQNFCLWANGAWLIQNDGYSGEANNDYNDPPKLTYQSNTLEVNGAGQYGESSGTASFANAAQVEDAGGVLDPAINTSLSYSSTTMDYMVGDASAAYPTSDGVTKFRRHLLYLKPSDVLVVVDDVALNAALPLTLYFYPQNVAPTSLGSGTNGYSTTSSNGTQLDFTLMTPSFSSITTADPVWGGGAGSHYCYEVTPAGSGSSSAWSNAVALAWAPSGSTPAAVTMITDADGTAWKFKVGTTTMVLDRNATASAPDEDARAVTTIEAESVTPAAPMAIYTDSTASNDEYIAAAPGTAPNIPDTLSSPSVEYTFNAPDTTTYAIWARVEAANSSSNSFYYALNPSGSPTYSLVTCPTYGNWTWVNLTAAANLSAGSNTLALQYAAANCKIDQIIITEDVNYTPTGLY